MDLNVQGFPIQKTDGSVGQRQEQQKQEMEDHLIYWKQQLANAPLVLNLVTDQLRSPTPALIRARHFFVLPQRLSAALKTLSIQEGCSLFITLLAAFQTLLHHYTGQEDLLVGIPCVEHTQAECVGREDGHRGLVNLLVLRTRMLGNPCFRELLGSVHEGVREAYSHQDVPFKQVVEALQPERDLTRHPLCQVIFVLEEAPSEAVEECDLELYSMPMEVDSRMARPDLICVLQDTKNEINGFFEYAADLFDTTTITRMSHHWQRLLEGILADPTQQISALPLLTKEEWQQVVVEWNDTAADYPKDRCIHHLFEVQAERYPNEVAVLYQDAHLTYSQLNQRANQLAHYLRQFDVGPEVLVGLCVERSLEMIVGLLGILKAGGAYVPLDPTYPSERLAFMLADAQISVLLTQEHLIAVMPEEQMEVICLDKDWDRISKESETNPVTAVMVDNVAYVIYTSGSTGTPKGVVIQHASLVNYVEAASTMYELKPHDRVLQFASLSFDASAEEIYPCLVKGATLVLRTGAMLDSVSVFLQTCQDWALTVLGLPTAYWHELVRNIAVGAITLPLSVRLVIIGGEKALPEMVASWQKYVSPDVQLMNTYGPTEATVVATIYKVPGSVGEDTALREVSIGRAIPNVQVYLLDRYLNPVPIGIPGELHIGGAGLAREYLHQPKLTAEKFIPHPFSSVPGTRLYRTSDLARFLPTGDIEFLGRLDYQVKVRGYRIELGEIERVLGKHPHVQEAVVLTREDTGDKRLIGYVVPRHGQSFISSDLRRFMQDRLPGYMVPATFVLLDALPLTPGGKVDRRALPAPEQARPELAETFVAPTLLVHRQLLQIWEDLLDVRPIGIRDNFFDLGGHSLLAVRLIDQVERVWGKKISSSTLLARATIEHLADELVPPEFATSESPPSAVQNNGSNLVSLVRSMWANLIRRRPE